MAMSMDLDMFTTQLTKHTNQYDLDILKILSLICRRFYSIYYPKFKNLKAFNSIPNTERMRKRLTSEYKLLCENGRRPIVHNQSYLLFPASTFVMSFKLDEYYPFSLQCKDGEYLMKDFPEWNVKWKIYKHVFFVEQYIEERFENTLEILSTSTKKHNISLGDFLYLRDSFRMMRYNTEIPEDLIQSYDVIQVTMDQLFFKARDQQSDDELLEIISCNFLFLLLSLKEYAQSLN